MRDWKFNHIDFSTYPYYGGSDLGVFFANSQLQVKIWAPTATEVIFRIYERSYGGKLIQTESLTKSKNGCWELSLAGEFSGRYYTIRVNDGDWLHETPGIDARAVGANGKRGFIYDPLDTNPEGWDADSAVQLENPVDAVLYELHVRDFSKAANSGMLHKGRFKAFTEDGTLNDDNRATGIDHLKELGITHVHLLPIADYFTVDENHPDEKYNWGYDPLNYNTPEGSYASDPNSISRILEFKEMVLSLHEAGIGVVMDVVYNHTGYTRRSWFNQTVPGYYYRQNRNGSFSNASGCGNEIASERSMVRKYMIDSLCYWAREYHIDGFRFDLMGIHDLETMNQIRKEFDKIRPGILMYGEGWAADRSPMDEKYRAVKHNTTKLDRIASFNDDLRDAVKGNNFDGGSNGFVSGKTLHEEAVKFGVAAACYHPQIVYSYVESSHSAWADQPWQCVNYVSCHDNFTLFDKLFLSCPDADIEQLKKMQMLAGAILLTSQGIPFLHAGVEFCRSKQGDHNSYKSADVINQIDWSLKTKNEDVFNYFKSLIDLRKKVSAFRMRSSDDIRKHLHFSSNYQPGVLAYAIHEYPNELNWKTIQLIFNANKEPVNFGLVEHSSWHIIANGNEIKLSGNGNHHGSEISVPPISMMILVQKY
ncbi:type I pullulanase [Sunxiuqinia sp. A32]|uniref:type I pullulanase n=1 Tax=Sunxiuqinia sp. A32 TaxID=3461496 RepID=UPI0040460D60